MGTNKLVGEPIETLGSPIMDRLLLQEGVVILLQ